MGLRSKFFSRYTCIFIIFFGGDHQSYNRMIRVGCRVVTNGIFVYRLRTVYVRIGKKIDRTLGATFERVISKQQISIWRNTLRFLIYFRGYTLFKFRTNFGTLCSAVRSLRAGYYCARYPVVYAVVLSLQAFFHWNDSMVVVWAAFVRCTVWLARDCKRNNVHSCDSTASHVAKSNRPRKREKTIIEQCSAAVITVLQLQSN